MIYRIALFLRFKIDPETKYWCPQPDGSLIEDIRFDIGGDYSQKKLISGLEKV